MPTMLNVHRAMMRSQVEDYSCSSCGQHNDTSNFYGEYICSTCRHSEMESLEEEMADLHDNGESNGSRYIELSNRYNKIA